MPIAPRNSSGMSTPVSADVRQNRRHTRASRSATRNIGTAAASVS
jgi:hypothetical protein